DFARFAAEERRDLFPRLLDRIAQLRSKLITTRRIGEIFLQKRLHRLLYRRIDRRRRVVIEVSDLVRRDHGKGLMVSLSGADVNRRRLPGLAKNLEGASSASLCSAAILAVGPTGILPV